MEYDPVKVPAHYQGEGMQARDVISMYSLGYDLGCAMKYIIRHQKKQNPKQDIQKAIAFLKMFIQDRFAIETQVSAWEVSETLRPELPGFTSIMKAFRLPTVLAVVIHTFSSLNRSNLYKNIPIIIADLEAYENILGGNTHE